MLNTLTMNPRQLTAYLTASFKAGYSTLITGAPGIGKTDLVQQAAILAGFDIVISHPAVEDPTSVAGLPWMTAGATEATFMPFGQVARVLTATRPTVWFLDDLGQATAAVQAAYMQYLLGGELNGHKLPSCVVMVAATNRRIDRAGVAGILEPVKSRFYSIIELETSVPDWSQWAISNGIPYTGIAFLQFRPELLSKFEPTADLTNSPTPRTWAHCFALEALTLPADIEAVAMAGAVGEGASAEYLAFRAMAAQLVNLDAILMNPDKAPIPSNPSALYATAVGLATRANAKTFARIGKYANRMVSANHGEFAVLMVRSALDRDATLAHTDTFIALASTAIGDLISGRA